MPPDALPASATFVLFWTAGLTTVRRWLFKTFLEPCHVWVHSWAFAYRGHSSFRYLLDFSDTHVKNIHLGGQWVPAWITMEHNNTSSTCSLCKCMQNTIVKRSRMPMNDTLEKAESETNIGLASWFYQVLSMHTLDVSTIVIVSLYTAGQDFFLTRIFLSHPHTPPPQYLTSP